MAVSALRITAALSFACSAAGDISRYRSHWFWMQIETEAPRPSGLQLLEDEDFVWSRVWPLVSGGERTPPGGTFAVTVHRRREDGRTVVEYDFDGVRVFAKLYPDDAAGRAVYRIHDELWRNGFGAGALNRVPEPLGYLGESGVVLARSAVGECLGVTLTRDWSEFEEGVARSARWLAALHTSSLSVGPREEMADGALRLARRVEMAAVRLPELAEIFRNALAELATRYDTAAAESSIAVQTHGRYHAAHVFIGPESITAIDLDRAAFAAPAKDVGEFVASLNSIKTLGLVDDRTVDKTSRLFLAEYIRHGAGVPYELSYYWSYCIVWALVRQAFKDRPERRRWRQRVDYLRSEFDDVPRRAAALIGG
jgi:hypothetical protein